MCGSKTYIWKDWKCWHMITLRFQKGWKEEQEMAYFKKEKYVPSSHIHATSFYPAVFLAPDTAFTLKMCCYPYGRGGKNESVSLLSSENLILTGAGLLFIFHLTKPIFFSSHTSSICRPSLQQSQMPAKQTAVGGESSVAGISSLYSAGGQPVKHGEDRESNFLSSKLLPLLISKEGSWGHEQKDKTSLCALKYATLNIHIAEVSQLYSRLEHGTCQINMWEDMSSAPKILQSNRSRNAHLW